MKQVFIGILALTLLTGCRRSMETWSEEEGNDVKVHIRSENDDIGSATGYRMFVYNPGTGQTALLQPAIDEKDNFKLEIAAGDYKGYCVLNASDGALWDYRADKIPKDIFLNLKYSDNNYRETGDYLLGKSDFTVGEKSAAEVNLNLIRKVARLRVCVENVPENMGNLCIHVSSIPRGMNLEGTYMEEVQTVAKDAKLPDDSRRSVTSLMLFPPQRQKASLFFSYEMDGQIYETIAHEIDSIEVNRITDIKAVLHATGGKISVDFTTHVQDWDENVIQENDWYVDMPEIPIGGGESGKNLVANGSFEEGLTEEGFPSGWRLGAAGVTQKVVEVNDLVKDGNRAVRMIGKTYMYQDIKVIGGKRYQMQMFVNSPFENTKWRQWCMWMKDTHDLVEESKVLRYNEGAYQHLTNGYVNVSPQTEMEAPAEANKLRIEIRTYMDSIVEGEGVYVDAVVVKELE